MSLENFLEGIDFSRSNIYWDGPSKGIFKLASVLEINQKNSSKVETTFGLGKSVLAGNMYVTARFNKPKISLDETSFPLY